MASNNVGFNMTLHNATFTITSDKMTFIEKGSTASPSLPVPTTGNVIDVVVLALVNGLLVFPISLFGTSCNIITMVVLYRMGFKDTTNILLFSLAMCDFLFLFITAVQRVETFLSFVDVHLSKLYFAYCRVYLFATGRFFMMMSINHTALIAIERFLAVFFPFKVSIWITKRRTLTTLAVLYIVCSVMFVPIFARFQIEWPFDPIVNRTIPLVAVHDLFKTNVREVQIYLKALIGIVVSFTDFGIVCFCGVALCFKLARANQKMKSMSARSTSSSKVYRLKDVKTTRMLLTVCIVYVLTNLPTILFLISNIGQEQPLVLDEFRTFLNAVFEILNLINSSANFFIYTFMATKFYNTLKELMCCMYLRN